MVQQALESAGIHYVRIDGKVSPNNRQRVLDRLRDDPEVKVILLTISCGALG